MKLDNDKFRNILLEIETLEPNTMEYGDSVVESISDKYNIENNEVIEYLLVLEEGGFIRAGFEEYASGEKVANYVAGLTYEGHELLIKIRNETTWNNIKTKIKEEGLEGSIDVIKKLAEKYLHSKLDL